MQAVQIIQCPECGVVFGIDAGLFNIRKQDNRPVHCTNGHQALLFQENPEAERLARIVERQEAQIDQLTAAVREQRLEQRIGEIPIRIMSFR